MKILSTVKHSLPKISINDRAKTLKGLGFVGCVITVANCGGGGSVIDSNPTLRIVQKSIDLSTGGMIQDDSSGLSVYFPPATDVSEKVQQVSLEIHDHQVPNAVPKNFETSSQGFRLVVNPSFISSQNPPQVRFSTTKPYDPIRTVAFLGNDDGVVLPMTSEYDSTTSQLKSTLTPALINAKYSAVHQKRISIGSGFWIIYQWGSPSTQPASSKFYIYNSQLGSAGTWTSSNAKFKNDHVAVVVHGMSNDVTDMTDLARFLARDINEYTNYNVYDEVWGYEYNWKAHINESGDAFAAAILAKLSTGSKVDIYAHSMGGLVSRWAIEKRGVGAYVHYLLTLDTPHEGVPLNVVQLYVNVLAKLEGLDAKGSLPGVEDLVAPAFDTNSNSFLHQLNDQESPYKSSVDYFTTAGTEYQRYLGNTGSVIEELYNPWPFGHVIDHDGIVPVYSANSFSLQNKSSSWNNVQFSHRLVMPLTHNEVNGDPDNVVGGCSTGFGIQCFVENDLKNFVLATLNGGVH